LWQTAPTGAALETPQGNKTTYSEWLLAGQFLAMQSNFYENSAAINDI